MATGTELASGVLVLYPWIDYSSIGKQSPGMGQSLGDKFGQGFAKAAEKAAGIGFGRMVTDAGKKISGIGDSVMQAGRKISSIGGTLTRYITLPALGAGAALAGVVLAKGWARLTDIDNARAKLKGLGMDAGQITSLMDSALKSVKGTAFGLGEAAGVASNLSAAGVKSGKDMDNALRTIANTAALSGSSLEEIGFIFGKVKSYGKASMLELNQLMQRNIPIIDLLAESMGKPTDEIKKMVSEGKIGMAELQAAMEKFPDAAKTMGLESLHATMQNVWAAVSRVGEAFLGSWKDGTGLFYFIKDLAAKGIKWLDSLTEKAKVLGEAFSDILKYAVEVFGGLAKEFKGSGDGADTFADKVEKMKLKAFDAIDWIAQKVRELKGWWDGLSEPVQNFIKMLPFIAVAAGPALKIIGPIVKGLGSVFKVVGFVVQGIGGIISLAGGMSAAFSAAGGGVSGVFAAINTAIGPVGWVILGIVAAIIAVIEVWKLWGDEIRKFIDAYIKPVIDVVGEQLVKAWDSAKEALAPLKDAWDQLKESLTPLLPVLKLVAGIFGAQLVAAIGIAIGVIRGIAGALKGIAEIIGGVIKIVAGVIDIIVGVFTGDGEKVKEGASKLWEGIKGIFQGAIDAILGFVGGLFTGMWEFFSGVLEKLGLGGVVEGIKNFFSGVGEFFVGLWEGIKSAVQTVIDVITVIIMTAVEAIKFAWELLTVPVILAWELIKAGIAAVVDWLSPYITPIIDAIKQGWENFKAGVEAVWTAIQTAIQSVIDWITPYITPIITAITTAWSNLKSGVETVWTAIKTAVQSGMDKASSIVTSVVNTIKGIWDGISSKVTTVFNAVKSAIETPINAAKKTVQGVVDSIKGFFDRLKIKFPDIKLPHFKITGSFSISPPSVPKLSIDWYAKGGILTQPTIFGVRGNTLLGGGEAGHEAILPISTLKQYVEESIAKQNAQSDALLLQISLILQAILDKLDKMQIVLDSRQLVGALSVAMDKRFGQMDMIRQRGGAV